uniref:HDC12400 n=1 Tax=Drosophila melanogaster TaxID=7227 RepID=Q6IKI0_DROME|nr:TPA_inf: HDC12400 [Drosophila melanogaster]
MELLKCLICVLLAIQWAVAHPTFSDSPEPNLNRLFGYIGGIVNEGIRLHYPQHQSEDLLSSDLVLDIGASGWLEGREP